ncbi:zinc finger, CCCH-type containing protein [Tanacetum coccineum]|uniref:Zinc finger, CCCH-type containing protein n=1 Tax=Tanacetum coccineum TaxID=301880 RepID=A0ABQ5CYA4_9ASTR
MDRYLCFPCRKKHTYACPVFEATDACPQGSKCKLHHPKSRKIGLKRKQQHSLEQNQKNSRGCYFCSVRGGEAMPISEKHNLRDDDGDMLCQGELTEYISLGFSDEEFGEVTSGQRITLISSESVDLGVVDLDELIKPLSGVGINLLQSIKSCCLLREEKCIGSIVPVNIPDASQADIMAEFELDKVTLLRLNGGDLDNSTSNVLIPLDSWTSGLLMYKLPLSVEYGVSTSIRYGVSSFLSNTVYSSHQINTAYPLSLDTAYRSSGTEANSKRHFKTLSLDELRLPYFNLLSDQEYSEEEEEEEEAMAETMEQYMSKTRTNYGSGVARPKINNKDQFELKGQFLKELRENTFSGLDNEDANC